MTTYPLRRTLLTVSPLLASIPLLRDVAERFSASQKAQHRQQADETRAELAALRASLDELGIQMPLSVTAYDHLGAEITAPVAEGLMVSGARKIVLWDGRHRLEWATEKDLKSVPVHFVTEAVGRAIAEASVIGRRHWTKGQRAWLGVLQHPQVCEASEGRPSKENADSIGVSTAPALAARIGVSADTVNQAVTLYRLFYAPGMPKASAAAIEAAARREKYEHLIWGGSGLGAIIAGIGGGQATEDKPKAPTGFHHLEAPMKALLRLGKVYAEWSAEERQKAQQLVTQLVRGDEETGQPGLSEEFRLFLGEALAAA